MYHQNIYCYYLQKKNNSHAKGVEATSPSKDPLMQLKRCNHSHKPCKYFRFVKQTDSLIQKTWLNLSGSQL